VGRMVRQSWAFFAQSVSVVVFARLDVLVLSQLASEGAAGLYSAAYLVVRAINLLAVGYSEAVYPVLSRLFANARARFDRLLHRSLLYGVTLTLLAVVMVVIAARPIIGLLYQKEGYATSVVLLRVMAPFVAISAWNVVLAKGLMASNLQRRLFVVSVTKLGAGLAYYVLLTAWLGVVGTAIATVLASLTAAVLNTYFVRRQVCSLNLVALVLKPLAVGVTLLAILWLARDLPLVGSIAGGGVCYVLALFVFRIVSVEDVRLLREIVRPS